MTPRVLLQELPSGQILDWAVPLEGASPTRTLSGPNTLTGSLPLGYTIPIREWGSALWIEDDGTFLGGGIVTHIDDDEDKLAVTCIGITGYAKGMPWLAPREDLIDVDPLDIVRRVWTYLQSQPGGNLALAVDPLGCPVRVGEEERDVSFTTAGGEDVAFTTGPFRLNAVDAQDLQKVIDDLAGDTPFDYLEHTAWDGERIRHRLELGYPALGSARPDLRFVIGENVAEMPSLAFDDAGYASEVLVIGAGEGREAITAHVPRPPDRLRRVAIVADKSLRSASAATNRAREELARRDPRGEFTALQVIEHPNAPLAGLSPGDRIRVTGALYSGREVDHWVRILEITRPLDRDDVAALTVTPTAS